MEREGRDAGENERGQQGDLVCRRVCVCITVAVSDRPDDSFFLENELGNIFKSSVSSQLFQSGYV